MKFFLLFFVAFAAAGDICENVPGVSVSKVVTSTTTTTIAYNDDLDDSGFLSTSDRSIIRKTWNQARKDGDVAPQILFRFIKAHPEYQKMFKQFAAVPQEELLTNGNFLAQAYTILAGLNVVIQSIGSRELLANQMNALGGAHFERGVVPVMFDEFGAVTLEVLAEELGSAFNAEARSAWTNGLRGLSAAISKNLKNPEDLADPQTKLTKHVVKDVQSSWAAIKANRYPIVSDIFKKLFAETPRAQRHFGLFASTPIEQLDGHEAYSKQVRLVADRLDTIVSELGEKLQVLGSINYMRYSHEERGIQRVIFEDFARLFLEALAVQGVSADDIDSWKSALVILVDGITPRKA